ncbi:MAG: MBL fold metallo-hydrolase [Anaerolineae bacterium]|nr:MBL fold metallo-hydrolase [Anaerolineae bacterium]
MFELVQVGEKTYYIESPAKMGIYCINEHEVVLIDSGNDKDAGKKIYNILAEKGWKLKFILNTHSNADHVGGNAILQQRLSVPAFSSAIEADFNRHPVLEPSFLYGGYPCKSLRNKFLMAQPSETADISSLSLPEGLQTMPLEGHFFGMFGVKTDDDVWFLADCLMGENIINKYHISFIYDVAAYLATLDVIEKLKGRWFIPAHASACEDIVPLTVVNRYKVFEIIERILTTCREAHTFEEILKILFDDYQLIMDWNQYVLVGSTLRSYLSYLLDSNRLTAEFTNNRLLWKAV